MTRKFERVTLKKEFRNFLKLIIWVELREWIFFNQVDEFDPDNVCSDYMNESALDSEALPSGSTYQDVLGFSFAGMSLDEGHQP